jgi:DNA-binding NarL/FixJ family response regulator
MGLERLLENDGRFEVAGLQSTALGTVEAVMASRPDVLVLDFLQPAKEGLAILKQLRRERSSTRTVVLTAAANEPLILEAIRLGAILKVHAGGRWVETDLAARTMEEMLKRDAAIDQLTYILTGREIEVARKAATGLSNAEIAERLYISEGTVKLHLHHIYAKLHVGSRGDLAAYAREIGLV